MSSKKGWLLEGIYATSLHSYQYENELTLLSSEFTLTLQHPDSLEKVYWKLGWIEDEDWDDLLIFNEQQIPKQNSYNSSFSFQHGKIDSIHGYGLTKNQQELLTSIVIKLKQYYVTIQSGPAIEVKITKEAPAPEKLDDLLHR